MWLTVFLIFIFLVVPTLLGFWFVVYVQKLRKFDASSLERILHEAKGAGGGPAEADGAPRWEGAMTPVKELAVQKAPDVVQKAPEVSQAPELEPRPAYTIPKSEPLEKKPPVERLASFEKSSPSGKNKELNLSQSFSKSQDRAIAQSFSKTHEPKDLGFASTLGTDTKSRIQSMEKTEPPNAKVDSLAHITLSLSVTGPGKVPKKATAAALSSTPLMQVLPFDQNYAIKQEYVPADLRARACFYEAAQILLYLLDGTYSEHKIFGEGRVVPKGIVLSSLGTDPKILSLDINFLSEGRRNLYGQIALIHFESESYSVSGLVQDQDGILGLEISCQDAGHVNYEFRLRPLGNGLPTKDALREIAKDAHRSPAAVYVSLKAFGKVFKQPIDFDAFAHQVLGGSISINGHSGVEAFMQAYESIRGLPHGLMLASAFFAVSPGLRSSMLLNFPELAVPMQPPYFADFKISVSSTDYAFTLNELATANLESGGWMTPTQPGDKLILWLLHLAERKFPSLSAESRKVLVAGALGQSVAKVDETMNAASQAAKADV